MAFELREKTGYINKNNFKKEEKHPDYKGETLYNGKPINIALWSRKDRAGNQNFYFAISDKISSKSTPSTPPNKDGLPF
jgi:predicted carbohydrate-binding protein with CBM5 and CBM33 domain